MTFRKTIGSDAVKRVLARVAGFFLKLQRSSQRKILKERIL